MWVCACVGCVHVLSVFSVCMCGRVCVHVCVCVQYMCACVGGYVCMCVCVFSTCVHVLHVYV